MAIGTRNGAGTQLDGLRVEVAAPGLMANRVRAVAKRLAVERESAIVELNRIFAQGSTPPALDGRYRGELLGVTMQPAFDAFTRLIAKRAMWWQGKIFDAGSSSGLNMFQQQAWIASHILWPLYRRYRPNGSSGFLAFDFETSTGPGLFDPGVNALKLNYDLPVDPRFLVRSVLDEMVQVEPGYYLGKAHLKAFGKWHTVAYFALSGPVK